ncbi:hypothetical protein ACFL6O_00725 [candidate division KSB1 bacterium]
MKLKKYTKAVILVTLFLIYAGASYAQSVYNAYGIGLQKHVISVRAAGMGGAGIALPDNIVQNHLNPSVWTELDYASITAGVSSEGIRFETSDYTKTSGNTSWNQVGFAVKTTKNSAIGIGFYPFMDSDFQFYTSNDEYQQTVKSSGGTSIGYAGIAYKFMDFISIGAKILYYFGSTNENWSLIFAQPSYRASETNRTVSRWGKGYSIGTTLWLHPKLRIGAVYVAESELETELEIEERSAGKLPLIVDNYYTTIPSSFGLGTSLNLYRGIDLAFDYFTTKMQDYKYGDDVNPGYRNSTRYSAGFEFKSEKRPGMPFLKRLNYSLGGYYWDLYNNDLDGSALTEKFVTAGFSWQFNNLVGQAGSIPFFPTRIDIAIQGGIRSSETESLGSEKIFRFYISLAKGETWFIRRR